MAYKNEFTLSDRLLARKCSTYTDMKPESWGVNEITWQSQGYVACVTDGLLIKSPMHIRATILQDPRQLQGFKLSKPARVTNRGYKLALHNMAFFSPLLFCMFVMVPVSPVMSKADYRSVMPAERICKPGPPLKATTGKTNCLVIGDSISIG